MILTVHLETRDIQILCHSVKIYRNGRSWTAFNEDDIRISAGRYTIGYHVNGHTAVMSLPNNVLDFVVEDLT